MKIIKTVTPIDEFNYIPCSNWFQREEGEFYKIVCFKNHDILFPNFDEIITLDTNTDTNITKEQQQGFVTNLESHIKNIDGEFISPMDLIIHKINGWGYKHVYNFVFSKLSEEIKKGNSPFFKPKKSDYLEVKEKLSNIDGKIVAINGRNSSGGKGMGRNNSLETIINELIQADITVINCTIPSYNLSIDSDKYIDVSEDCLSYSKNISYFLNSHALVSIGNAGSITNHISTGSNIIITGAGGWVDNVKFGYEGQSLLDIRKETNANTYKADGSDIIALVNKMDKPIVTEFFDESKIKK